jgi:integrase
MAGKSGHRGWGWVRRVPSGRWGASYVWPPGLERHYPLATYATRMDAEGWLRDERKLIDQDLWTSPKSRAAQRKSESITLGEYVDRWIEQRNVKAGTRIEYKRIAKRKFDKLRKLPLRDITPDIVRAWHVSLGTTTPRATSHAYGLLHAVLTTAVSDELITVNPAMISRAMNVNRKREPVILTVTEVAKVADAIKPERLRCFVLVAAWCGLRWGESIELRRKDIDETCEVILVSRAVTHRGKREPGTPKRPDGCTGKIDTPKSGKGRAVVVPPHIRADLKHHLEVHVDKSPEALVFPALRDGCHLNDSVFAKHFAPALKTVGREKVRIHDLRHFAGTQTARVGNLVETMGRLGHSTVRASLIYQGIVSGRDAEIAAALSVLASDATGKAQGTG